LRAAPAGDNRIAQVRLDPDLSTKRVFVVTSRTSAPSSAAAQIDGHCALSRRQRRAGVNRAREVVARDADDLGNELGLSKPAGEAAGGGDAAPSSRTLYSPSASSSPGTELLSPSHGAPGTAARLRS